MSTPEILYRLSESVNTLMSQSHSHFHVVNYLLDKSLAWNLQPESLLQPASLEVKGHSDYKQTCGRSDF